jgi:peptidoglycan/LPS O-acetylase OafA/YrhL
MNKSPKIAVSVPPLPIKLENNELSTAVRKPLPYLPGLDGLRAIAVLAVLGYHAGLNWLVGGFLGVDLFFVISGFLITSLLLAEYKQTKKVSLKGFWWRRAKRLLPAVLLLLLVIVLFSVLWLPEEVTGLRGDVLAALTYVTNWNLIYTQRSYFEIVGRPPLLQHLWSLAVEEQFYIVWPILFSLGMAGRWRRFLPWLVVVGSLASTFWMISLYQPDVDPSRVYYGTDTRAAGLMVGVSLAFIWARLGSIEINWRGRFTQATSLLLNATGILALLGLIFCFVVVDQFQSLLYQGGFLLISVITAILILAVIHPLSHLGAWLEWPPLRWIGLRSYSIYLWHWPILNLTRPGLDVNLDGWILLIVRVALTLAIADISYRYVELPIRHGALKRWGYNLRLAVARPKGRYRVGALASVGVVLLVGLVGAVATAEPPRPPEYLNIQSGEVTPLVVYSAVTPPTSLATLEPEATSTPAPTSTVAPGVPTEDATLPSPTPTVPPPTATPKPAPPFTAVGDSILLGAGNRLHALLGPMIYEADVGMQAKAGVAMLQSFADQGQLGPTVIIMLGTNGYFSSKSFDDFMSITGSQRRVFFVNVRVPREWQNPNNQTISQGVKRYPNAYLIDWYSRSAGHPEYFTQDGVHLTGPGIEAYTTMIASKVK